MSSDRVTLDICMRKLMRAISDCSLIDGVVRGSVGLDDDRIEHIYQQLCNEHSLTRDSFETYVWPNMLEEIVPKEQEYEDWPYPFPPPDNTLP